ncbi:MAG TPA: hypothetical protein VHM88_19925 [Candidatus Acidoferrales bacterium]|nr:hypothetical protein [Candidatus Acidoferrales bacterium]
MTTEKQQRALATREARLALLELKKVVDDAVHATHAAELEAIHLAVRPQRSGDARTTLRGVVDRLRSSSFENTLTQVRQKLETAVS